MLILVRPFFRVCALWDRCSEDILEIGFCPISGEDHLKDAERHALGHVCRYCGGRRLSFGVSVCGLVRDAMTISLR